MNVNGVGCVFAQVEELHRIVPIAVQAKALVGAIANALILIVGDLGQHVGRWHDRLLVRPLGKVLGLSGDLVERERHRRPKFVIGNASERISFAGGSKKK